MKLGLSIDKKLRDQILLGDASVVELFDATLLAPAFPVQNLEDLLNDAILYKARSICLPPSWVKWAFDSLTERGRSDFPICTVVGFPTGYNQSSAKFTEVNQALLDGAQEIDFVQNISWVKNNLWSFWEQEVKSLVETCRGCVSKIILETALLSDDEITQCSQRAINMGVDIIKTSTGFSSRGASDRDIELIGEAARGAEVGIKASGGVRSYADAFRYIKLGATRIGSSSLASIAHHKMAQGGY